MCAKLYAVAAIMALAVVLLAADLLGRSLAPDDASIADNLVSWHRDAGQNYTNGVWKGQVGPDLVALGDSGNGDRLLRIAGSLDLVV